MTLKLWAKLCAETPTKTHPQAQSHPKLFANPIEVLQHDWFFIETSVLPEEMGD